MCSQWTSIAVMYPELVSLKITHLQVATEQEETMFMSIECITQLMAYPDLTVYYSLLHLLPLHSLSPQLSFGIMLPPWATLLATVTQYPLLAKYTL